MKYITARPVDVEAAAEYITDMSRRLRVKEDTDFREILASGDRVLLDFLPLDKYRHVDGREFPLVGENTVPFIGQQVEITIRGIDYDGDIQFNSDTYGRGWINRGQISHYKIVEKAPPPQAPCDIHIGGMRLRFADGDLRVNETLVTKYTVAQTAYLAGWEYSGGDAGEYFRRLRDQTPEHLGGYLWYMTDDVFRAGCASCSRKELDTALDWAAERFGWL